PGFADLLESCVPQLKWNGTRQRRLSANLLIRPEAASAGSVFSEMQRGYCGGGFYVIKRQQNNAIQKKSDLMQLGMIGLGRMGANMVRRLLKGGHDCVVFDRSAKVVGELAQEGATPSSNLRGFLTKLDAPRAIWMMVPAAVVDNTIAELAGNLQPGDMLIDGGNSYYIDDIRRAKELTQKSIHYVDVGTSGGVQGSERFRAHPDAKSWTAPPNRAISTAVRAVPVTS